MHGGCVHGGPEEKASAPNAQDSLDIDDTPTILLTGFEPFGSGKPPNPSWEGIQALHGTNWRGYRIICKRMPVVWGKPLTMLQTWIDQYKPAVILSLGQGGSNAFALESKASGLRGHIRDNQEQFAPRTTIVKGGPKEFSATTDCAQLQRMLSEKGYPIRVSTNAGKYLCEETLYCLEYLKWKRTLSAGVLFCHVPPLKTQLEGKVVDVEYLQQFVLDTIDAYLELTPAPNSPSSKQAANHTRDKHAHEREIERFILRYFRTWSMEEFDNYDACFKRNASIQFMDDKGRLTSHSRKVFIAQQRRLAATSRIKRTEVAESTEITFEADIARAVVYWKLTEGTRVLYGYDHFTLVREGGDWKIVNLLFYSVPRAD